VTTAKEVERTTKPAALHPETKDVAPTAAVAARPT